MQAAILEELKAEWFEDARFMIQRLAASNDTITADDLRKVMRPATVAKWTGLVFMQAHKAGDIEWVRYVRSNNKTRRGGSVSAQSGLFPSTAMRAMPSLTLSWGLGHRLLSRHPLREGAPDRRYYLAG